MATDHMSEGNTLSMSGTGTVTEMESCVNETKSSSKSLIY